MNHSKKAIVIGAGIAGIAAAIRLAHKGYAVEVFEQQPAPGGKLNESKEGPFRFDKGPSLFTMPHLVDELFSLTGRNPRNYFHYRRLESSGNYFFPDGTTFTAPANPEEFAKEWESTIGESQKNVQKYFKKAKTLYDITHHVFLEKSLHKINTYLSGSTLKSIARLPQIDALRTMDKANSQTFSQEKSVQFFNRYATYNGSSPYLAPATLNVISHIEHDLGAFFPIKGMHSIIEALMKLAQELGVKFNFNAFADEILVREGKAVGVSVKNTEHLADVVVSNMDVVPTYRRLLPKQRPPKKILAQERSSSAMIFYWGIKGNFPQLDLHNFFFSADYKAEFKALFEDKEVYDDPTIYLFISKKEVPGDAPDDCENWFVMINAPHRVKQNWQKLKAQVRKSLIKKLSAALDIDNLEALILTEDILDPVGIETQTSSYLGALYGNASNNKMAAFLRHPNFSRKIKNLYFVGGSVHPGGGIPLCLLSAKIAVEQCLD